MQERDAWDWKKEFRDDVTRLVDHYTPDKYPADIETQRDYDQAFFHLERQYLDGLEKHHQGERQMYDEMYPKLRLAELNKEEREALAKERRPEMQLAIRKGQEGERNALRDGDFRETDRYKEGMQILAERQAEDMDRVSQSLRQVTKGLDERFGFNERDWTRDENQNSRER